AGSESEFQLQVAQGLAQHGLAVARFDFPYMAKSRLDGRRRGPDPQARLLEAMRAAAAATQCPPEQLVLAGKSMGGRMATMLADDLEVAGVIALGYPFHPPGQPEKLRTAHLEALQTPCLILQGERDPFGTTAEVATYPLSDKIELRWLPDGDHSLKPRKKSGHSLEENLEAAIAAAAAFALRATTGQS
ncbi:MAG: alpha/beta family hydrolase, partial [Planctomycetota bacterium]|nr:alpha/beta family hydrolase [Planctomycetota bacterium]